MYFNRIFDKCGAHLSQLQSILASRRYWRLAAQRIGVSYHLRELIDPWQWVLMAVEPSTFTA
jgi:hypothetical protein